MKVLVVGGGGREHAIAWKLKQSPLLTELYIAPGNPATEELGTNVDLNPKNIGALAVWAANHRIDLTIVGPEAPLADGLVDIFVGHGLKVFGPSKTAARLESSKSFAKEIMKRAGVRTAASETFSDFAQAEAYVRERGAPIVVKADGLAAGKGVVVAESVEQAVDALRSIMLEEQFGASGARVVVEDYLVGREASIMAIVDGDVVLPLVVSQDYKRLGDGDAGPNTGGMGAISPTPVLDDRLVEGLIGEIFMPVLRELMARGIHYRGFLYGGVMVSPSGAVDVIEFNCRLGDPETQVIMMRLDSDLLAVLHAAVTGKLASMDLKWNPNAAVCVVAASRGYPGAVDDGKPIEGLFAAEEDLVVFQAGTEESDGVLRTKGGRVLAVTARAADLEQARNIAYRGMERIQFDGKTFRKDIGSLPVRDKKE